MTIINYNNNNYYYYYYYYATVMTHFAHVQHEFMHVVVRDCRTVSYVSVKLKQPAAVRLNVLSEQQLRRRRVLHRQTCRQTLRQTTDTPADIQTPIGLTSMSVLVWK